jgi:hypothetical protein
MITARWELAGERLLRRTFGGGGADLGARPMLDRVVSFRWRPLGSLAGRPLAVELEIVRRREPPGSTLRAGSARWHQIAETLEETRVIAASRLEWP